MHTKKSMFKKRLIASAVASATVVGLGAPMVAHAQPDSIDEVIVVTGIRASLDRAADIRRHSQGVVDAIVAEDIGKMPDTNLAESLQRITGVSIDRSGGEGSRVTVRGLGPDFNLVTINGRSVANTTGGRSFEFANVAAEMVSQVNVHKTGDATMPSGGMGATINLVTFRPLDNPGQRFVASGKLLHDTSSTKSSVTPDITALYSNTFADDTFGVTVALNYHQRKDGSREAQVGTTWRGFDARQNVDWGDPYTPEWGAVPDSGHINRPTQEGQFYAVPQTIGYFFTEEQRERINGNLVLQWRPMDNLTATFDYTRLQRTVETQQNDVSAWFTFAPSRNVFNDAPVATPVIYSETYFGGDGVAGSLCSDSPFRNTVVVGDSSFCPEDFSMGIHDFGNRWTTDAFGLNLEWDVLDNLSLFADFAYSEANRDPYGEFGNGNVISTAAMIRTSASGDFTTDIPTLVVGGGNNVTPQDMVLTGSVISNFFDSQEVTQFKLGGNFEINDMHNIDFGFEYSDVRNHHYGANVQRNDWAGEGYFSNANAIFGERQTIIDQFDGSFGNFSDASQLPHGGTLEDGTVLSEDQLNAYFAPNFRDIRNAAISGQLVDANGNPVSIPEHRLSVTDDFVFGDAAADRDTTEETMAFYAQYNFQSDFGLDVQLGLRYETTDVTSSSRLPSFSGARWIADTEIELLPTLDSQGNPVSADLTETGSYDHVLPNLNLSYEIQDGLIARFSASKTIARGSYNDIAGGQSIGNLANQAGGGGSQGNPGLLPFESVNLDLSIEWYYAEGSYVSLGYFHKDVSNFISTENVQQNVFGIRNPAQGGPAAEARGVVGGQGVDIRNYIFDNFAHLDSVDPDARHIYGTEQNDLMIFNIATPNNAGEDQSLDGIEFNVQHMFGDSGFGAIFNYTYVNPEKEYDVTHSVRRNRSDEDPILLLADQEALLGVSDTMNIIGFYDRDGINVRLAYNWRDKFLASRFRDGATPMFTDKFAQLDLSASYEINDNWTVFLEGINILDEPNRLYGRDSRQTHHYVERGSRWALGTRFTF